MAISTVLRLLSTLACLAAIACWIAPAEAGISRGSHTRVTLTNGELYLDGLPWQPFGLNAYQLATDWSSNTGCGPETDLDSYFAQLPAGAVTRFWAFQSLARDRDTGEWDFGPIDRVFDAAARHGQLVIPVLTSQWGTCEDEAYKDADWYRHGWENSHSGGASFADWIGVAVTRWHSAPALAMWELVNEPETQTCATAACHGSDRICTSDAGAVLLDFTDRAGEIVRSIDSRTLITAGLIGSGQCGSSGQQFQALAESPYVDVVQVHDYTTELVPGDRFNGLELRLDQAAIAGKPLLVGEMGLHAGTCLAATQRAQALAAKIEAQRSAGTAGTLLWSYMPAGAAGCRVDISPGDPAISLIADLLGTGGRTG